MPVVKGTVEGQTASVLRDTGCSAVIVRRSLVPDDKMTDQVETCILIDGTVRHTPVADIQDESPYFSGVVTAMCMKRSLYDLIIGNISGVVDPQPASLSPLSAQPKVPDGSASTGIRVERWVLLLLLPVLLLF